MTRTPLDAALSRAARRRCTDRASASSEASTPRTVALGLFLALPSKACLPNVRAARWERVAAVAQDRTDAGYTAMQLLHELAMEPPRWVTVRIRVQFRFPNRIRRDTSNYFAGMKPQWDGLVDAGILMDDERVIWDIPLPMLDRRRPGVDVRIEEATDGTHHDHV